MRGLMLLIGLIPLFLLGSCGEQEVAKANKDKRSILENQMKAMEKARQVQGDIDAAMKKREREMNR